MARRDQVTRKAGADRVIAEAEAPELIRVRTVLVEVERHARGYGQVEHDPEPDLDLLIHTGEGIRIVRELPPDMRGRRRYEENLPTSVGEYDEYAQDADLDLEVVIKGTAQTLEIIRSVAPTSTLVRGGARALKTQTGSYWSFRQWMMRGSSSGLGWFVGPDMSVAHVLKDKWLKGEGEDVPPICPPELVVYAPEDVRDSDQHIRMVDGFSIRLLHASTQGKNMPGRSVDFVQWTEAAVTASGKPYARVRGRVTTSKGAIYLDAVPESSGWTGRAISEPAIVEDQKHQKLREKGEDVPPPEYAVHQLDSADNPWNDEQDAANFRAALEAIDPRLARREAGGEDIGDANKVFGELFDQAKHTFDFEGWEIPDPDLGSLIEGRPLIDITRHASLRVFDNPKDWIAGVDINARPHTAFIFKVGLPPGRDKTNPHNWVLIGWDGLQVNDVDSEEAADRLASIHGGLFRGAGVIMDATSCLRGHNAGGALNKKKGVTPRKMYENLGFEVKPPGRHRGGKRRPKNPEPFDASIVQRRLLRESRVLFEWSRCRGAIRAIRDVQDGGDGMTPKKTSNDWHDRAISSWIETWRYVAWPIMGDDSRTSRAVKVRQYA